MLRSSALTTFTAVLVLSTITGCGPSRPPAPTVPDTPDGTVTAVAQTLAEGKPEVLWVALPASYQKEVQDDLVRAFAKKMDPEMYGKGVTVLKKLVGVLGSKKDLILPQVVENPLMQMAQVDKEELGKNWGKVVGLFDTILQSELGDIEKLKTVDIGKFLATTGAKVMQHAADLSAMSEDDPYKKELQAKAAGMKAEVVKTEGDKATLKLSAPGETDETVELVKVEGKWLPAELVDGWADAMKEAKAAIAEINPEAMAQMKPQVMGMLVGVETALDQLAKATTAEEFSKILGGLMGSIPFPMGLPGMGGEDMPPGFPGGDAWDPSEEIPDMPDDTGPLDDEEEASEVEE